MAFRGWNRDTGPICRRTWGGVSEAWQAQRTRAPACSATCLDPPAWEGDPWACLVPIRNPFPTGPVSDFRRVLSFLRASASLPTQFGDWTSSSTWTAWQRPLELKVEKNSDISWLGCGHQPPHMARDGCPVSSGHQTTLEMRVYTRSLKVWAVMKSSSLEDDLWKTDPKSPH